MSANRVRVGVLDGGYCAYELQVASIRSYFDVAVLGCEVAFVEARHMRGQVVFSFF
jgi:hypothetical protein